MTCLPECDGKLEHYNRDTGEMSCACGGGMTDSEKLDLILSKMESIETMFNQLTTVVDEFQPQIMPYLEAVERMPLVRALGLKVKKG